MENKTEQNCLISVIVPAYNILDCLERCVNSICAQTWKNLEILLVDDGSTDGTGKLCDLLAEKDDRIRVFHKPNGGSSSARNLGISMAKGKWIGFVDSDDWIEPQMYERLYEQQQRFQKIFCRAGNFLFRRRTDVRSFVVILVDLEADQKEPV